MDIVEIKTGRRIVFIDGDEILLLVPKEYTAIRDFNDGMQGLYFVEIESGKRILFVGPDETLLLDTENYKIIPDSVKIREQEK